MAADEKDTKEDPAKEETKKYVAEEVKPEEEKKEVPPKKETEQAPSEKEETKENIASFSLLDADKPKGGATGNDAADDHHQMSNVPDAKKEEMTEDVKKDDKQSKQISSDEVKDWLKDVRPDTTKEQEKGGKNPIFKWLAVIIILLLVGGAVAGGIYYYRQNVPMEEEQMTEEEQQPSDEQQEQQEEEPTATPVPEDVDLTDYSVNVLNGSGVVGEAGAVADLLTEAGFSDPDTGNAETYDYTVTEIQVKEDVPENVVEEVSNALNDSYTVNVLEDKLADDSDYDIIVTVGEEQ